MPQLTKEQMMQISRSAHAENVCQAFNDVGMLAQIALQELDHLETVDGNETPMVALLNAIHSLSLDGARHFSEINEG